MKPAELKRRIERLERQALRTSPVRHPLYERARLDQAKSILDVGCGNGAVTRDLARFSAGEVHAVDVDPSMVLAARETLADLKRVKVHEARAEALPFADKTFDAVVANLVLMWIPDPVRALREMGRVAKAGGVVLASMEPDYGGKIHWPENPVIDQIFQGPMIQKKGGDPHAGRKLRGWFVQAGLPVTVGLSNPHVPECAEDLETYGFEKEFYHRALEQAGLKKAQIAAWENEYLGSLRAGVQFNFLPLFYALGTKR